MEKDDLNHHHLSVSSSGQYDHQSGDNGGGVAQNQTRAAVMVGKECVEMRARLFNEFQAAAAAVTKLHMGGSSSSSSSNGGVSPTFGLSSSSVVSGGGRLLGYSHHHNHNHHSSSNHNHVDHVAAAGGSFLDDDFYEEEISHQHHHHNINISHSNHHHGSSSSSSSQVLFKVAAHHTTRLYKASCESVLRLESLLQGQLKANRDLVSRLAQVTAASGPNCVLQQDGVSPGGAVVVGTKRKLHSNNSAIDVTYEDEELNLSLSNNLKRFKFA